MPVDAHAAPTPSHPRLSDLHSHVAMTLFGDAARRAAKSRANLRHALEQAHIDRLPEEHLARTWLASVITFLVGCALVLPALAYAGAAGRMPPAPLAALAVAAPAFAASCVLVALSVHPDYRAGERRRLIDKDLPYAVNYVAAMASAGVVPAALLRDLAREKTYGEVAREAAWMVRDLDLLGMDLLTALTRGAARSPSKRFQELLQGARTAILSGGDLKIYFAAKAEQYMAENRRAQKEFLDGLGVLAESYVTVVIAGPLFMLVMLVIMMLVGNAGASAEGFLFFLVFAMLPVTHAAFSWVVRNMAPEV